MNSEMQYEVKDTKKSSNMTSLERITKKFDKEVDKGVAAYFNYGADKQVTVRDNVEAFDYLQLKPSPMQPRLSDIDLSTSILGQEVDSPIGIAPTAFHKLMCPRGELATAEAAASRKVCYIEGLASTTSMEEIHADYPECFRWKNIYPCTEKGKKLSVQLMEDAERSGLTGFVFSIDNPNTEFNPGINPTWKVDFSGIQVPDVTNAARKVNGMSSVSALSMFSKYFRTPDFTWNDYKWLVEQTGLPVIAKGILTAGDAREAVECGSAAVYVSNHGGRWLDSRVPTLFALPEVVAEVGDQVEVYMDGGIRNGADVFKALALGARAVFLGRPVIWGLGADGSQGVKKVLDGMVVELKQAMAYTGCTKLSDISRDKVCLNRSTIQVPHSRI